MFRAVPLSIIRSLFTVHSAMVYVIQVCRQLLSRSIWSCSTAVCKPVWHIPLLSVQWINSWWWTEELPKTCTVSCQNKFVKLVHLFGFIIKIRKFKFHLTLTRIKGTLLEDVCIRTIKSNWILLRMRNISDKHCRKNQKTHFMFNNLFLKIVPFMR